MQKADLRKEYKLKRKALSEKDISKLSSQIAEEFLRTFDLNGKTVHFFLSIQKQREIETSFIWKPLLDKKVKLVVSKSNFATLQMEHFEFNRQTELELNDYGIPEPYNGNQISTKEIDVVIIPILAFDNNGNRLGYGKGFYDRFLADCRNDCIKVGLSYFDPVEKIEDVLSTDIPLDFCITPHKTYHWDRKN